jgi:hypothetical protein
MKPQPTRKCCLCDREFSGYGNNAEPLKIGICCDVCNVTKVIPERLRRVRTK